MADKGSGKGFPIAKKKVAFKSRPAAINKQPSTSMEWKDSPMQEGLVEIVSDSDSEGFVNGGIGTSSQGNGKVSKESGKKPTVDNLKTNGKSSSTTPASKGDFGKGGKASSGGKSGLFPSSLKSPITEIELKLEMDIPKNARVLMDSEAASILQGIHDSLSVLSDDPDIKMPDSFNKALQYCKARNSYTDTESARQTLETLKEHGVSDGEICMIGNVCPETIDEVYALVPSLKANMHKNERPIREVLLNLSSLMRT